MKAMPRQSFRSVAFFAMSAREWFLRKEGGWGIPPIPPDLWQATQLDAAP